MDIIGSLVNTFIRIGLVLAVVLAIAAAIARNPGLDYSNEEPKQAPVSVDQLKQHVSMLTSVLPPRNFENPGSLEQAAGYIAQTWRSQGLPVSEQVYKVDGRNFKNVIVSFGPENAAKHLVIGAHYDVDGRQPGADDNASGVAGLLELSRLLSKQNLVNRRVDLVAYTLEEMPNFGNVTMGSAVHAASLKTAGVKLDLMISLEMIGYFSKMPKSQRFPSPIMKLIYPTVGDFVALIGNLDGLTTIRHAKEVFGRNSKVDYYSMNAPSFFPGVALSDHARYWEEGFPAIMITDTAMFRNANYHKPTDTADSLDYQRMAQVVQGVYGLAVDF